MKTWDILTQAGYEIRRWDETNCSFDECDFVKKAYEKKKWGFVADYYRTKALYEYGWIYLDTDIVVNKVFDDLLENKAFIGFFYNVALCTAVVGAEKGSIYIKNMLNMYETGNYETEKTVLYGGEYVDLYKKDFLIPNNECWTWCTIKNNPRFKLNNGRQQLNDVVVYPKEYFETGAVLGDWYTRHLNTNTWKKKQKEPDLFFTT